ncbi:MAG: hypothetical protein Q9P90_11540 [candidate division KSB1 bacterium]|nr:hypothetical protein [candidate division KSB1 bacterium]
MLKDTLMQSYAIPDRQEHQDDVKLDEFYLEQVNSKIEQLELALSSIDQNGHFDDNIKTILNNCMQIMDLGMIHGYEGVEAIAETMFVAARYCAQKGSETIEEVRPKLMKALEALKEVVELTDPLATQDLIDRARIDMDYRIDDLMPGEDGENDDVLSEPIRNKVMPHKNGESLFEIHEFTALPQEPKILAPSENSSDPALDEEAVANEVDNLASEEESPAVEADHVEAFLEGEYRYLADDLNQADQARLHGILDNLEDSIGRAETGIELDEAIDDIKAGLQELEAISFEEQFKFFREIVQPLTRVAMDYLENDWVRLEVIAAIREGSQVVRELLQKKRIPVTAIAEYRNMLEEIENKAMNKVDSEQDWLNNGYEGDDIEMSEPPRLPFIVRLKKVFGMY